MTQSQHYAGVAFDAGQALNNSERNRLRIIASTLRSLNYVKLVYFILRKDIEKIDNITNIC